MAQYNGPKLIREEGVLVFDSNWLALHGQDVRLEETYRWLQKDLEFEEADKCSILLYSDTEKRY